MAFAKAAARDMKSYLRKNDYRDIAVGYAAAGVLSPRRDLADYLSCGDRPVDFLGINLFSCVEVHPVRYPGTAVKQNCLWIIPS